MTEYTIRPANEEDIPFLREMLYEAAYWRKDAERPALEEALDEPDLHKILLNWGRPGDVAMIAVDGHGTQLGATWYRFWTSEDHSYGFVNESTPELSMGVRVEHRRQGVGTALLKALFEEASRQGVERLSLSVAPDNEAHMLYEKLSFKDVDIVDGSRTMMIELV